jgi:cytoskeletal protein CcmA (bactofilin family)
MIGSKNNTNEQLGKTMNMLGTGTVITGDIKTEGDIRIDGKVIGTVTTNAKLAIGETGIIEGNIQCRQASIEGKIKGNLVVSELAFLRKSAVIDGDLNVQKLVMEEGAKLNGRCSMGVANTIPTTSVEFQGKLKKESVGA